MQLAFVRFEHSDGQVPPKADFLIFWYARELGENKPADGVEIPVLREIELESLVQVINVNATFHNDLSIILNFDALGFVGVILVDDVADDLFQNVFHRHDARNSAVLVEHDGQVDMVTSHRLKQ